MKYLKGILLFILLGLIAFVAYTLISTGYFRKIENKFEGTIIANLKLAGAEDITISLTDSFALISATDRAAKIRGEKETGHLYLIDLKKPGYELINLTSSFPKDFAPHGVSMIKQDSSYKVVVINHTDLGHSLEFFQLYQHNLTFVKTLNDPTMISPNDIVLLDGDRFYFTNDHAYERGFLRLLEDYAGYAASSVIYYDGENYQQVASGIGYANGINFDKNRNLLFVASPRKFLVKVYHTKADGTLDFIENIVCKTGVDNIEFDSENNLWIGCHPDLLHFAAYAKGKKNKSPSEIIKLTYIKKGTYSIEQIYMEDGSNMSASTVAAPFGNKLFLGNVMDDNFLIISK